MPNLLKRATVLTVSAITAITLGTGTAHAALTPSQLAAVTDDYSFSKSLSQFSSIRNGRPYADQLDWSSDACSWSPDKPLGFDFVPACHRHDFGYRNNKRQGRWNADKKLRVDDKFKADMYGICGGNVICKGTANLYYSAVRKWGT
ncbi:phospholipase [Kibdelosporangium philippinense]|uniref:Phospholipase n=1 Tax=Kibdelosporangium philippinense TaxID=211113 RepID=A0ABS8ZKR8_9PSEU|nr:phospholipase [Kibdelosporangium philippinense]MCE7007555.1 phospholipase [Kibdelosporangium philippinense]